MGFISDSAAAYGVKSGIKVGIFPVALGRLLNRLEAAETRQEIPGSLRLSNRGNGIRDEAGAFRVIYVASLSDAVYVLHAFQKKTEKTAKGDIELARKRFSDLTRKRR